MVHKYGMDALMSRHQAWAWHRYLAIPFFVSLFLHVVPYYVVRKQVKRLLMIVGIIIIITILSVLIIDKFYI